MDFKDKKPFNKKSYGDKYSGHEYKKREPGSAKPLSYTSTCAECAKECEVPFKPTGRKPVLCAKCFNKDGTAYADKPWMRGAERIATKKPMHAATCDRCSTACEVPFEPVPGRAVYCASCLGHGAKIAGGNDRAEDQFAILNAKLDAVLKALSERK